MANFEVKFNEKKNAMDVCDRDKGVAYSLKIMNMAPDHSFPRWTVVDLNNGEGGGGKKGRSFSLFKWRRFIRVDYPLV